MKLVTPEVYHVASTEITDCQAYFDSIGAEDYTAKQCGDAQTNLAMIGGKLCYRSFKAGLNANVTRVREDCEGYIENIHAVGHGSVIEHGSVTFIFKNISRVFSHELCRHRIGTAISQESLRFVRLQDLSIWKPPIFEEYPEANEIFHETVEYLENVQKRLAEVFDLDNQKSFATKKFMTSHMRRLAPIGLGTSIMWSANMRTLRHVIQARTSRHAEEEIRLVFGHVAQVCKKLFPLMMDDFVAERVEGYDEWTTPHAAMPYDQEKIKQLQKQVEAQQVEIERLRKFQ